MIPKYKLFYLFSIIVLLVFLVACKDSKELEQDKVDKSSVEQIENDNSTFLYFINKDKTKLVRYELDYNWKEYSKRLNVENIISKLKEGIDSKEFLPSIPKEVIVNRIDFNQNNNSVVIDLSRDYEQLSNSESLLLRASIVLSLTDLEYISAIKITVDGQPMLDFNGQPIGFLDEDDIVIAIEEYLLTPKNFVIALYFANEEGTALVPEIRTVYLEPGKTLERIVLEELIKGPKDSNLKSTIPEGTKIIEVIEKDGICYVDLNEQFLYNSVKDKADEHLTVYSIVNSLTDLYNINQVQFLIQGVRHEKYKSMQQFNKLFSRNLDIIDKK